MEKEIDTPLSLKRSNLRHISVAGFSLVETMVAVAIVGTAVAGLSGALVSMKQANDKTKTVYAALTLQSELIAKLADEDVFRDTATGNEIVPSSLASLPLNVGIPTPAVIAVPKNTLVYFTNDLQPCASLGGACTLSLVYGFNQHASGIWRAAYRIRSLPSLEISVANLGAPGTGTTFTAPDDYRTTLPDLVWKSKNLLGCTGADELAMMGFNRNNGTSVCLRKPSGVAPCPNGEFAKRFVVRNSPGGPELVLDCQAAAGTPARTFTCPGEYNIQSIPNPQVFDSSFAIGAAMPQCVWRAQEVQSFNTSQSGPSIVGVVCPRPPTSPNAYTVSGLNCIHTNFAPGTPGGCVTIAGCPSSMVAFPATVPSFGAPMATAGDSVNCVSNDGITPVPGGCFPGSYPGIQSGIVSFSGPRTCTLNTGTYPLTKPATSSLP